MNGMRKPARSIAAGLALWFAVAPALATGQAASDLMARYSRGEVSLHEYEAARRGQLARAREAARASAAPASPSAVGEDEGERATGRSPRSPDDQPSAETGEAGSKLGKIGRWIKDIPTRTFRRWKGDEAGFETAAEATQHIENAPVPAYTANAAQREADSNWTRPLKVTARGELDTIQTVIERVVGVGGLAALAKAMSGDRQATKVVETAGKVVARMNPAEKAGLLARLQGSAITKQVASLIGGKPTSALGRIVKDKFGNNMILAVAAAGVVGHFMNDGLDMDTMKDHLVSLNAVESRRTWRENLVGVPLETVGYFHLQNASTGLFERIWNKVGTGSGGLAAWVGRTEKTLTKFGQSIVKRPPPELAAKAAQLGNTAKSLGLPGVSGATALTFKGLAEATFGGVTLGLIGIPLINTAWKVALGQPEGMYIGGGRDRIFARYNLADTYFQQTGDTLKDAIEERKVAVKNQWERYRKFPYTMALKNFLRVFGGFMGAVVASSVIAPVGIASFAGALVISAVFSEGGKALGKWIGAKLDTRGGRYDKIRKAKAEDAFEIAMAQGADIPARREALRALAKLDRLRSRYGVRSPRDVGRVLAGGGSAARALGAAAAEYQRAKAAYREAVAATATQRATEIEKLLKASQVDLNVRFVGSLSDIKLVRKDGYVWVVTPDGWKAHASPRFDFVDSAGRRGVWDPRTNRIIDAGPLRLTNGNRIAFVDDQGLRVEGGKLRAPDDPESADGNVVITKNGVILERGRSNKDTEKSEWKVLGYGGEYDVVLRGSGRRFAWDGEAYAEVDLVGARVAATDVDPKVAAQLAGGGDVPTGRAAIEAALADLAEAAKAKRGQRGALDRALARR